MSALRTAATPGEEPQPLGPGPRAGWGGRPGHCFVRPLGHSGIQAVVSMTARTPASGHFPLPWVRECAAGTPQALLRECEQPGWGWSVFWFIALRWGPAPSTEA